MEINNETNFNFKYEKIFKKIIKITTKYLNIEGNSELGLIIINNEKMKEISKKYRNKDETTDILSFPSNFKELKNQIGYNLFGDIFLSWEMVEKQANQFGHSSKREWCYLFVHGFLHLIGFNHKTKKEEKEMNKIAYKIMDKIKVSRND